MYRLTKLKQLLAREFASISLVLLFFAKISSAKRHDSYLSRKNRTILPDAFPSYKADLLFIYEISLRFEVGQTFNYVPWWKQLLSGSQYETCGCGVYDGWLKVDDPNIMCDGLGNICLYFIPTGFSPSRHLITFYTGCGLVMLNLAVALASF